MIHVQVAVAAVVDRPQRQDVGQRGDAGDADRRCRARRRSMPATCVPWSALPVGAGGVQPSGSVKSWPPGSMLSLQVGVVGVDLLVDDGDGDARARPSGLPGLRATSMSASLRLLERPLDREVRLGRLAAGLVGGDPQADVRHGVANVGVGVERGQRAAPRDRRRRSRPRRPGAPACARACTPASARMSARSAAFRPASRRTTMSPARACAGSAHPSAQRSASVHAIPERECVTLVSSAIAWGP